MSPKKRKSAREQTTEELMKRVFPQKAHEHLKAVAHSAARKRLKSQEKPESPSS
jgi:hypothetical protein